MNIDNIFYIIKSTIISVPSNTWQRSFRTTLHSWQTHSVNSHSLSDLTFVSDMAMFVLKRDVKLQLTNLSDLTQVTAGLSPCLDQL